MNGLCRGNQTVFVICIGFLPALPIFNDILLNTELSDFGRYLSESAEGRACV